MVCPACLTAALISQLPALSAAAVSAAGVKLAYDKRAAPKAAKALQKISVLKVNKLPKSCDTSYNI